MEVKEGVVIAGLDLKMRPVLVEAEKIWKRYGRTEGVTVTSGLDGVHSAGSLHYYGRALDFRTRYFSDTEKDAVFAELKEVLDGLSFDIIKHSTHIHVELDPK